MEWQTTTRAVSVKNWRERRNLLEMVTNRICQERSSKHILSEYSKLTHTEYKKRHDKVATMVHRELCSKYGFESAKHWYEHRVEGVMENQDTKILWDFNIWIYRVIKARHPDIVLINKKNQETLSLMWLHPGIFLCQEQGGWKDIEIPRSWIGNIPNVK